MKPSPELVDFIKRFEGFREKAYRPLPTDRWTVGFGSTYIGDNPVTEDTIITESDALDLLRRNIEAFAERVSKPGLHRSVTNHQFDAVVSLVYNIGFAAFMKSTTATLFYGGHDISERFGLFIRSGGKIIPGLVRRRQEEKEIYVNGVYAP